MAEFTFAVRETMCESCIYRPDSSLDIVSLEDQVRDPKMAGHFKGFRMCHTPKRMSGLVCRGFWDRHRDHFDGGQLAQRLGIVEFTNVPRKRERRG